MFRPARDFDGDALHQLLTRLVNKPTALDLAKRPMYLTLVLERRDLIFAKMRDP